MVFSKVCGMELAQIGILGASGIKVSLATIITTQRQLHSRDRCEIGNYKYGYWSEKGHPYVK